MDDHYSIFSHLESPVLIFKSFIFSQIIAHRACPDDVHKRRFLKNLIITAKLELFRGGDPRRFVICNPH